MGIEKLPDDARVWVYQTDRALSSDEASKLNAVMIDFVSQWQAHGTDLAAGFELRDERWLILAVDEKDQNASGCSIDASVKVIKALGEALGVDFFNRQLIIWKDGDALVTDRMHDFWAKRKAHIVSDDTVVFNTLAKDVGELRRSWQQRFAESRHAEMW